jgi:hypothetical protein
MKIVYGDVMFEIVGKADIYVCIMVRGKMKEETLW